ncbi:uncharacterized protein LOC123666210 [Melitaea cinxia]|uniref:uncharacterized protein LOC123666210 n=1 Tax=Melitaea cinxia TaxID=113334 RepID=UPI001E2716F4|nr:uncharacterized protein LOC123666210 [Melitaea cinxia]
MAVFSSHEDEILIELVSKNAPLFDTRLQAYKDNTVRDNIWEEIGKALNKTIKTRRDGIQPFSLVTASILSFVWVARLVSRRFVGSCRPATCDWLPVAVSSRGLASRSS